MSFNVHIHGILCRRGGAARVPTILSNTLAALHSPLNITRTAEIDDSDPSLPLEGMCTQADSETLISRANKDTILHLHNSKDWPAALLTAKNFASCIITLHDVSLFTGGCPFPMACNAWLQGCSPSCSRNYRDAQKKQAVRLALLNEIKPTLVTPSAWLKNIAKQMVPNLDCTLIPNGVDDTYFQAGKQAARQKLGIGATAKVLMLIAHGGQKAAYKVGNRWIELWDKVKLRPDVICIMAGGDAMETQGRLIKLPYLDRETLSLVLTAADVLAYPTIGDNHPLIILEALSAQTPVVAFNVGGIREQLATSEVGLLVEKDDWNALASNCQELLDNTSRAKSMELQARSVWQRHFTAKRMSLDYLALYKKAINAM